MFQRSTQMSKVFTVFSPRSQKGAKKVLYFCTDVFKSVMTRALKRRSGKIDRSLSLKRSWRRRQADGLAGATEPTIVPVTHAKSSPSPPSPSLLRSRQTIVAAEDDSPTADVALAEKTTTILSKSKARALQTFELQLLSSLLLSTVLFFVRPSGFTFTLEAFEEQS